MDIKSVIRKYGFTVNSLATKHGVGQSRLNQMVNGNPSAKNLEWLASLIGCSPAEFFADWVSPTAETQQPVAEPSPSSPQQPAEGGQQEADNLPFKPDEPADTEQPQQAEQVRAVRFTYECPKCGERISVTIE